MKTIVITKGSLDTLDVFAEGLIHGFELLQYNILVLDKNNLDESVAIIESKINNIVGFITLNNYAINLSYSTGENVWDKNNIWCINILVDHPFYFHKELSLMPVKSAVLCVDINHMKYVERFYPNIAACGMMSHGGCFLGKEVKPINDRSIEVLYAGSIPIAEFGNIRTSTGINDGESADPMDIAYNDVYNKLINNPKITLEQAVESYLQGNGIGYEINELLEYIQCFMFIEKHAVSYYRELMLKTIAISGMPITICGSGWDKFEWVKLPNVTYKGMVTPTEVLNMMADSKIVVNSMLWFKNGSHERVYNGMLQGTIVISDKSIYFNNISDKIVQIHPEDYHELPQIIEGLLGDPDKMQIKADMARDYAASNETWECRAKEISDAFFENC